MVGGHEVVAHEVLFQMQPWAAKQQQQVVQSFGAATWEPVGHRGLMRLRANSRGVPALLAEMNLNAHVALVEPNYIIHASDTVPNDPEFPNLWGMQNTGQVIQGQTGVPFADIGAVKAWDVTQGSSSIVVGVVDTGVDYTHGDLSANIWTAPTSYQVSAGGSLYVCPKGSHGFNFIALTCNPLDDNMHGTHVSGTIGAQGNNFSGVTGVNWTTSIIALKFLDQTGAGSVADAINAIEAAIQLKTQGVNIRALNNSWGLNTFSSALLQAVNDANASDILFVAAAGNSGQSNDGSSSAEYPASFSAANVISVAATDNQDGLASFSNYGAGSVHLGAPGVDIESTIPGGYGYLSGTSMATPHVTGTAALLLSACTLNTSQLKAAILNSVDPIPSLIGKTATGGRVNVYKALIYCGAAQAPQFSLTASPAALTVAPGASVVSQIKVVDSNSFSGTVTFSASGLPSGVTASFSPPSITGSGSSMLTLSTTASTAQQTYSISVFGASSSSTISTTVNLNVAAPDFSLSASPASVTVALGGAGGSTIAVGALNGFSGVVNLTASGMPVGVTASFSSGSVSGSGSSTLNLTTTSNTAPGSYPITVQGVSGSLTHTATVTLTVNGTPDYSLSAFPGSVNVALGGYASSTIGVAALSGFGDAVNLTASGMPFGVLVSFNPSSVTGSGVSILTLTASANTTPGTYPISIQGVGGSLTRTTTVTLTVNGSSDFTLSATPGSVSATVGNSASSTIGVAALSGFNGAVNLTASGMPAGVLASFNPASVTGSGVSILTLATSASTAPGTYPITIQGASGSLTHTTTVTLTVNGTTDYALSAAPASVSAAPGGSASSTIAVSASGGFGGAVGLTASGMPAGVTASFAPASITGSGSSTLTLSVAASTTAGVYPITVRGASGNLVHTTTVTLTVTGAPDYALSAAPVSVNAAPGGSANSTIAVNALSGFGGAVSLTASGMPAGVTASFSPASVTGSGASNLTLTVSASATAGTYAISVTGASGSLSHTATVSLTITAPDFTLAASPAAVVVSPGSSATSTITVGALNGFSGSVNLTANGLPSGVTVSFSPASVSGPGNSTLTVVTSANTPAAGFSINVQGVSGSLVHTATVAVSFQASIVLPASTPGLLPGSSVPYPVTLGAPATGNVYVSLTSSDTSKVTVIPATIVVPAGSTTPSTTPKLNGVNFGPATITASAWTYASATQAVVVTDSFAFFPNSLTIGQGAAQYLTLTLAAALSVDLTVNLSSDNPGVATVPASVTLRANTTSVSVRVTAVGGGSATIHANGLPMIPDTTATVTVGAALTIATTSLSNGSVNVPYSQTLMATGGTPPLTWALISGSLPTGLTLNPATGQIGGTPTAAITNTPLTFKVTDANFPPQTATANLTLTIASGGAVPSSITASKGTPQSATVNKSFAIPLVAMVADGSGKPLGGVAVTFSAPGTGATGSFGAGTSATVTTDSNGAATTSFTANGTAGSYTVAASVPGPAAPALFLLTNLAGPAANITATGGSGQGAAVNTTFGGALVTLVSDASGNPVTGAVVTFTVPATGASGIFGGGVNTAMTNTSGVATSAPFTANGTPGTYSVTASVAGVAAQAAFSLTNVGPATSILAVSGGGQSQSINTAFINPLVVKVQDAAGNPVAGVTVAFVAPSTGASGIFSGSNLVTTSVTTNASGIATAPKFTANSIAGNYMVTASVAGVGTPAVFSLINLSGIILQAGITPPPGGSTPFPVTLGVPAAAGGVYVALASSDPSTVTITPNNIFFPGGSTTPTVTPRVNGINLGSATITASAWTYQSVSQQVQVSETLSFFPGSVTMGAGGVQYVMLTLSSPAPTDLTVNLSSDNPGVASAPQTVTFPANSTTLTVRVTAGTTGSANITAGAPPSVAPASLSITVM